MKKFTLFIETSKSNKLAYKSITVERRDNLGLITLNRPKIYNAVNEDMYFEVADGLK